MKFTVEVIDRNTFKVTAQMPRDPSSGLVEDEAKSGVVQPVLHHVTAQPTGYWQATVTGRTEPIKSAKSRGGCIFAILQHYAGI